MDQGESCEVFLALESVVGDFSISGNAIRFRLPPGKNLDGKELFEAMKAVFPGQMAIGVSTVSGGPNSSTEYIYIFSNVNR